jgi:hypothetical protein
MKPLLATIALLLASSTLLASADLSIRPDSAADVIRAGFPSGVAFAVRNAGPDTATKVTVTLTSSIPVPCSCSLVDIPAGQTRFVFATLTAPATAGPLAINASVSSDTPDPDPSDNSTSLTLTVSTDPDVGISLAAPVQQDLALPFPLSVYLTNLSASDAHDVDVTIDFRPDVTVKSLPAICSNVAAGRIICRIDTLPAQVASTSPAISATLVAPPTRGNGSIVFTATVTERERDFNPSSNTITYTTVLYETVYVTTTADSGKGSLRQAILDMNTMTGCRFASPCAIAFRIAEPSATPWKTIRVTSPLPMVLPQVRIDGATQTRFFGDTNPDGPEIEISGGGTVDGDGLLMTSCAQEVANLAINSFLRNGVSVTVPPPQSNCTPFGTSLHHLFIGTDPTGSSARPNARGIGTSAANGTSINGAGPATDIHDCVISGNLHSGIFGLSGRLNVWANRIGVKAHADEPLPNGNSGVFIGLGGYGSDVGTQGFVLTGSLPDPGTNVIAFNGEMGVAVAAGVGDVAIRNNRIWGNALLGIDIGLNGPTPINQDTGIPILTLAHYDPVSGKTIIEGDIPLVSSFPSPVVHLYANDAGDPSGYGEGQRPIGAVAVVNQPHFRFEAAGDLTGQYIAATTTRFHYVGDAKPEGISQLDLSLTSEFSRWLEVR